MRLPEPTPSGEWSPALPGLDRVRLRWVVLVQLIVTVLMVVNLIRAWLWTAKGVVAVWMMVEVLRAWPGKSSARE